MHDDATARPWVRDALLVGAAALVVACVGFPNEFTYDDVALIQENARVHRLGNWWEILVSPYWPPPMSEELYRPVMSLLLALQYALGGGGPLIFRVVTALLYAVAAIGTLGLARRILPREPALAVGLLFAAHPVHVEALALGVNQGELIVGSLAVFMLAFYLDRRRAGALSLKDWSLLAAGYGIACLTKENGFVIPGLLLAAELFLIEEAWRARLASLWRGYGTLLALGVLLLIVRTLVLAGDVVGTYTADALVGRTVAERLLTVLQVVPIWLRLLAWPARLQLDYSPDELLASTHLGAAETLGLVCVALAVVAALFARRRAPAAAFGLVACAIALIPVSNLLVPVSILVAERTLFLPSAGFLIALASAAVALGARLAEPTRRRLQEAATLAAGLLLVLGMVQSVPRLQVWRNNARLWRAAALEAPRSRRVQQARRDAVEDLVKDFAPRIAASREPWNTHRELAALLYAMGDDSASLAEFRQSVAANPDQRSARRDLAQLLLNFGHPGEAKALADSELVHGDPTGVLARIIRSADSLSAANPR